jgi:hypothetical protein
MDPKSIQSFAESAKAVTDAVPIYQDAVQPAAKEVGKALQTLAKTVHIALAPVTALVWSYEQIADYVGRRVSEKLKDVPADRIQTPPANVAGPALEAMRFAGQLEELRDMYASLLAASMDSQVASHAHPGFVEIIKQLTTDEAKILRVLSDGQYRPLTNVYVRNASGIGKQLVSRCQGHVDEEAGVIHAELFPSYIDNLSRLGLVEVPPGQHLAAPDAYKRIESDPVIVGQFESVKSEGKFVPELEHCVLRLTDFGKQFVAVCIHAEITALGV